MRYDCLIFDLDQTLIDSSQLESLRKERKWATVNASMNRIHFDSNLQNLLTYLSNDNKLIAIVTNSPSSYATAVISHFQIPCNKIIGYHDVKLRKPHPEPFLKVIETLNVNPRKCLSLGDSDADIIASKAASLISAGVTWYSEHKKFEGGPDFIFNTVSDLANHLDIQL